MRNQALVLLLLPLLATLSCGQKQDARTQAQELGLWRGIIEMQGQELPFHFRISGHADSLVLTLINGREELLAGPIHRHGDSLLMPMHIFDTEIRALLTKTGELQGFWTKGYEEDYRLPFQAKKGENFRFEKTGEEPEADLNGRWAVSFMAKDSSGTPNAVGVFQQNKSALTGTFLTPTGDYRFLEGNVAGKNFFLSAFDGEHAYLFKGNLTSANQLEGTFWSGRSWEEKWIAVRNDSASLPPADSLTYLKPGYDQLAFSFPNLQGEKVSLSDPKYQGKVVIVQLLGTWCPNCMDETRFLAEWHRENKAKNVAIIGLAYEKKGEFEYARQRLHTMADRLDVEYDLLVAGSSARGEAAKSLPMLSDVKAFPTTIFIDKAGKVRRIHTGFNGPGTGEAYQEFKKDFNEFVESLLREPVTASVEAKRDK